MRRVVLVGNKISPGNPVTKPDGTVVRTLWGEFAYQLSGPEALEQVRADDERATNPGDTLRTLLERYGPCLVLIDEWVSYTRQLHDGSDLPAGSFETHFIFAQAEDYDEAAGRYRGLQPGGRTIDVPPESAALLVRPDAARRQWDAEAPPPAPASPSAGMGVGDPGGSGVGTDPGAGSGPGSESSPGTGSGVGAVAGSGVGSGPGQGAVAAGSGTEPASPRKQPRRFHGAVTLDATRAGSPRKSSPISPAWSAPK